MEEEVITLTMEEKTRYEVIRDSLKRLIKVREAAELLSLSVRQIYRLRSRVKREGIKEFIPKWNKKFAREPKDKTLAYRPIPKDINLNDILCIKEKRTVYPDNTISYKNTKYQILPDPYRASYAKAEVEVFEHLNGKISIVYKQRKLKYRKITTFKKQKEDLEDDISILQKR